MRKLSRGSATDTIFALATGAGRSAVAVIRLSGVRCGAIVKALCGDMMEARVARLRHLRGPTGEELDRALVLWMPFPNSYTGEDCLELHIHGGRAVIAGVMTALVHYGARPADPGEFTRRAVANGKLDLLEAEAVADLIDSQTAGQRNAALQQLAGGQTRHVEAWARRLSALLALQEALIDFAVEDLGSADLEVEIIEGVASLQREIAAGLVESTQGARLREGLTVVIAGSPNVGKSSLLNALAGRNAAIVSPQPGTTRDIIEVQMEIAGLPITLIDTAGLRDTIDAIEAEGVKRARASIDTADLILLVTDGVAPLPAAQHEEKTIWIRSKTDLAPAPADFIGSSVVQPGGLDQLLAQLSHMVERLAPGASRPAFNRARHKAALRDAGEALDAALSIDVPELRAEELRHASSALGRLVGETTTEDVLDLVFASFCIGK